LADEVEERREDKTDRYFDNRVNDVIDEVRRIF
jgi:hypothetical protein